MNRKRKTIWVGILMIVVCMMIGFLAYELMFKDSNKGSIVFQDEKTILEYGSQIDSKTFVQEVDGEIAEYPSIDTNKIGEQEVLFMVQKDGKTTEVAYPVEIMDTQGPIISFTQDKVEIKKNSNVDILSYIKSVKDPVDGALKYAEEAKENNYYIVESDIDLKKVGEYTMKIHAVDKNGLRADATLKVEVVEDIVSSNANGNDISKPTYIKDVLLVNKEYGLPADFGGLDETAYSAYLQLQANASIAGFAMPMLSGYRSYETQVGLYNSYIARDGQAAADRYSARPGYSEHQTGLCFDVGAIDNDYGKTDGGKWLASNAHTYGFIIRFPEGKEDITGYMYEPWHIRYVGEAIASEIYQKGITLEEYLGVHE